MNAALPDAAARRPAWPAVVVTTGFVISRALYYLAGVRFDARSLDFYWHFIDPALLRTDLARSLFYAHGQPPLFNLYLGIVLKLFPGWEAGVFHATFLLLGLLMALATCLLMLRLGVPALLSAGLTLLWSTSPVVVLYENWLFNSYPLAALLILAALFAHRFLQRQRTRDGIVLFALLAGIVLMGSFFHPLWFVLCAGGVGLACRKARARALAAAAGPLLIVLAFFLKNLLLYGIPAGSSWFGMNLARVSTFYLPEAERRQLVAEGRLSELALISPLSEMAAYEGLYAAAPTGIPILDRPYKSTGAPSLDYRAYLDISAGYLRDALYVIAHHPAAYGRGLQRSFLIYFFPASDYFPRRDNRACLQEVDRLYNALFCGQIVPAEPTVIPSTAAQSLLNAGLLLVVGFPFLFGFGLWRGFRALAGRPADYAAAAIALFCSLNIAYVTLVGNLFEVGENNRFRFVLGPFFIVLLGMALAALWKRARRFSAPAN